MFVHGRQSPRHENQYILLNKNKSERGKEIQGVDLVLIDSDTIGLASKFIGHKGHLSIEEIKILENCLIELKSVIPYLEKKERQYFDSLRQLAEEILELTKGKP